MKKTLSIVLAVLLTLSLVAVLASCGSKPEENAAPADESVTAGAAENETTEADVTDEGTTDEVVADETTTEEETDATITEGVIELAEGVKVELTDGWYCADASDTKNIKLEKDGMPFLANIHVEIHTIYTPGEGAEAWAGKIDKNYGGGHAIDTVEINGISYWRLDATDDGTQTQLFADLNENYYLQVSCMFFDYADAAAQLEMISIG